MSYQPPSSDSLEFTLESYSPESSDSLTFTVSLPDDDDADFVGIGEYTSPSNDDADFTFGDILTRSVSISGNGAVATTRQSVIKSRIASINGNGSVETERVSIDVSRSTTLSGSGKIDTSRTLLKPRNPSIDGNGAIETSRQKDTQRTVSYNFETGQQITLFDLQEVFPDEEALDVSWDYEFDPRGFATEWFDETSEIPRSERGGFGVTFNGRLENEIEIWIQHDTKDINKGIITSNKKTISKAEQTVVFDERSEYSDDGLFRVFVRGLRQEDVINQVDVGSVHDNL